MSLDWVFSPGRVAGALALLLAYVALCVGVACSVRKKRLRALRDNDEATGQTDGPAVLVAYASQTGQAENIARELAKKLRQSSLRVMLLPVDALTVEQLRAHERSIWIVSTTGEGDAPDHALRFVQLLLSQQVDLKGHESQVLALGDLEYKQFCWFGERVNSWLNAQGSNTELVCVDNMDRATLRAWQSKINERKQAWLGEDDSVPATAADDEWLLPPASTSFRLNKRVLLNPGSQGGALYQLDWVVERGELPHWESGDLASVCVPADPEFPRDYSIASIMQEGCLRMLVRQSVREDGSPGVASSWLCNGMNVGDALDISVRQHSSFRLGENAARPLILIGNGSGLAGLLSHIKARIAAGRGDQWLIFGERHPQHDAICSDPLQHWWQRGELQRLDLAWSRHETSRMYVQDMLVQQAQLLDDWLQRDAAIYVCGSLQGMGQGVHDALKQLLGEERVHLLIQQGRYKRDVY